MTMIEVKSSKYFLSSSTTSPVSEQAKLPQQSHMQMLDGVRGLAALYVLVHHALLLCADVLEPLSGWGRSVRLLNRFLFGYGHNAVDLFIVLSGYCLMLPVLRGGNSRVPGGISRFLKRRSWRILPSYYAAILISLLLLFLDKSFLRNAALGSDQTANILLPKSVSAASLVSHLLLLHNLDPRTIFTIDVPLWSVAVEWQIYFLFVLLLLPIRRRCGMLATVAAAFGLGLLPQFIHPFGKSFDWTDPWYLGLFSLGMLSAEYCFSPIEAGAGTLEGSYHWSSARNGVFLVLSATLYLCLILVQRRWYGVHWLNRSVLKRGVAYGPSTS